MVPVWFGRQDHPTFLQKINELLDRFFEINFFTITCRDFNVNPIRESRNFNKLNQLFSSHNKVNEDPTRNKAILNYLYS